MQNGTKSTSVLTSSFGHLKLLLLSCFLAFSWGAQAQLIESATDDLGTFGTVLQGNGKLDLVNNNVRGGTTAFKHQVSGQPRRSEIDDNSWHVYPKGEYWYGFSYFLPSSSFSSGNYLQYMSQFRFSNIPQGGSSVPNCLSAPCGGGYFGGSGCHLLVKNGQWHFSLQRADPNCASCRGLVEENFDLIPFQTNVWTDVVIQANWSHLTDGFIRIWIKFGDGSYQQVLDHNGITWFDTYAQGSDRSGIPVSAPNFTVGLYYGSDEASRTAYSDEIRVWQGTNGFDEVSPTQSSISQKAFAVAPNNNEENVALDADLSWNTFEPATSYDLYYGTSSNPSFIGNFTGKTYNLPTLSKSTTYYWRVDTYYGSQKVTGDNWQFTTIPPPNPCEGLVPSEVYASQDDGNIPLNAMDCDFDTRWSGFGDGTTLTFEFDAVKTVTGMKIAWHSGDQRSSYFDIQVSNNGSSWTNVLTNQTSSGSSLNYETFNFPSSRSAKYVRYVGRGNSSNDWNSIKEVAILGSGGPSCTVGAVCDDGNPNNTNDVYDSNCVCAGIPGGGGGSCNNEVVTNGDFDNGLSSWIPYVRSSQANASHAVVSNALKSTINNGGSAGWHVKVTQEPLSLASNTTYTVSLKARASKSRSIRLIVGLNGSPYTTFVNKQLNLSTGWQTFSYDFTSSSSSNNVRLIVEMGGQNGDVYLDDVSICSGGGGSNCTVGASCNDGNNCTTNDTYDSNCNCVGTFQDSDGDGICDANDNCNNNLAGQSCDDGDPNTTNDVYDSNCVCAGTPNGNSCSNEAVSNGDFSSGMSNWTPFVLNGQANANLLVQNNEFRANISNGGSDGWHIKVTQQPINLSAGIYTFSTRLKASSSRTVRLNIGKAGAPYTKYLGRTLNLTSSYQTFTYTFNVGSNDNNVRLFFEMGGQNQNVFIDDVSICAGSGNFNNADPSGMSIQRGGLSGNTSTVDGLVPLHVQVTPNPATNEINVYSTGQELHIFDLQGRLQWSQQTVPHQSSTIDINHWQTGIYIIKAIDENGQSMIQKLAVY